MSATLPPVLDAWRMVAARRYFEGELPLSAFKRLKDSLTDSEGVCRYRIEFGRGELDLPFVEIRAETHLPMLCQRSLERYLQPVSVLQRLGLITDEAQEAELPEGTELEAEWPEDADDEKPNPFAALAALKERNK